MENSRIYIYAAVWYPAEEQAKAGQKPKLIVEPTYVLALHTEAVSLIAARAIPEEYTDNLDQISIAIRPF